MMKSNISRILSLFLCIFLTTVTSFAETGPCDIPFMTKRDQAANSILNAIANLNTENPELKAKALEEALKRIVAINDADMLHPALRQVFKVANERDLLPIKIESEEKLAALSDQFYGMVEATLIAKGMTKESRGQVYKTWEKLDVEYQKILSDAIGDREMPAVDSYEFQELFAKVTNSKLRKGNTSAALIDGPEAFEAREVITDEAKSDVTMVTWAVYDDETGEKTYQDLKKAKDDGRAVRVMVDGLTAKRPGYNKVLKKMGAAGFEVIYVRFTGPLMKYFGQHRKMYLIDGGTYLEMGGMNPGDVYSHMGNKDKWRDTDVLISGPAAKDAYNLAVKTWNQQVVMHDLPYALMEPVRVRNSGDGNEVMALTDQDPSNAEPDNIYLSHLLAIRAAREGEFINITNAYVILTPSLRKELKAAIERGAIVRVLSNSDKSVDEPIVSRPIMESLKLLSSYGAQVFLRRGTTIHAKIMTIGGRLLLVMSYNKHPRSLRFEGEVQMAIWGGMALERIDRQFEIDISPANAIEITHPDQIDLPPDFLNGLISLIFFDSY